MPILNQIPRTEYVASGSQTVFPTGFLILSASDLTVYVNGVLRTLNVDYTVSGVGLQGGGNVTFGVAPSSGSQVIIQRSTTPERTVDYPESGAFRAAVVNRDFNRLWAFAQEHNNRFNRTLYVDDTVVGNFNAKFIPQPNKVLGIDGTGQNLTLVDVVPETSIVLPLAVAQGGTGATNAASAATNLGVIRRDGSLSMTGNFNVANNRIINLGEPTAGHNAATLNALRTHKWLNYRGIINGDFHIWQRSTSTSTTNTMAADRWWHDFSGGTSTTSRVNFTIGDVIGNAHFRHMLRQSVSGQSAAGHYSQIYQVIEDVRTFSSATITVLGWYRTQGSNKIVVHARQWFGTGGSPSSTVTNIGETHLLGTSSVWQPFAVTMNIPSISGKTLGTNDDHGLMILFTTSAGSSYGFSTALGTQTGDFDFAGIHILPGEVTTSAINYYQPDTPHNTLIQCQRYYEVGNFSHGTIATAGTQDQFAMCFYTTPKRVAPTSVTKTNITFSNCTDHAMNFQANGFRQTYRSNGSGQVFFAYNYAVDVEL